MKPTKMLIEALLDAAVKIEDPESFYDWGTVHTCNCGMLAQSLLNKSGDDVRGMTATMCAIWSDAAEDAQRCHITGRSVPEIMVQLAQFGIDLEDYKRIEFCDMAPSWNGNHIPLYQQADYVAGWFRQLARELQAQRKAEKNEFIP